jgi:hypothetical protein
VKDTPPGIERKFRKMLLERSGQERLKMGCSMHGTAQALAKASISNQHPNADPAELKRLFFLHFYGADFEPKERKRIAAALAKRGRAGSKKRKLSSQRMDLVTVNSSGSNAVRDTTETYGKAAREKGSRSRKA